MRDASGRMSNRIVIDGLPIDAIDLREAVARIDAACRARTPLHVVTLNIGFVTLARRSPAFRDAIAAAPLVVADGRLLCWVARWRGTALPAQITGHDLLREGMALAAARGLRVLLLGGPPGVAAEAARRLAWAHPGAVIEGDDGGRFAADGTAEQGDALVQRIRGFAPDLLFVGLGAPKQERWIAAHLAACGASVAIGVGGVLDTLAGHLPRAPRWMQVAGLESLFQLGVAPRRYARRYLLDDPPTLLRLAWQALRMRMAGRRSPS